MEILIGWDKFLPLFDRPFVDQEIESIQVVQLVWVRHVATIIYKTKFLC